MKLAKLSGLLSSLFSPLTTNMFGVARDLELNRSSSAVSMSCDNSDYSYAQYGQAKVAARTVENMTELLEEPVEEAPQQVGLSH